MAIQIKGDYVLVAIEKVEDAEITLKNGTVLQVDTDFSPTKYRRKYGIVVSVPKSLSDKAYYFKHIGMPNYSYFHFDKSTIPERNPNAVVDKYCYDCKDVLRLQKGETLYFNHNGIIDNHKILGASENNELLYRVPIESIIAKKDKNGNIIGMCGNVICEPILEDKSNLITSSGIITSTEYLSHNTKKPKYLKVKYTCEPLGNDERIGVKVGNTIITDTTLTYPYEIDGKEYEILLYKDIDAVVN